MSIVLPITARSAIFEQKDNSEIIEMTDGAPQRAPSVEFRGADFEGTGVRRAEHRYSSVIIGHANESEEPLANLLYPIHARSFGWNAYGPELQLNASRESTTKNNRTKLEVPKARPMSRHFSESQIKMQRIAADVAEKYSGYRGVIGSKLDKETFIALFTAMIHRESNFNPLAVSRAGAKGLGQLMPDTARELGVTDVFSARQNLDGSARYFAAMLELFRSPVLALAAYNAGPGAVRKYRGIPPYRETNQYLVDIIAAVDFHRAINASDNSPYSRVN